MNAPFTPLILGPEPEYRRKTEDELMLAQLLLLQHERDYANITPGQRDWLMGARAALSWALGLPKGGKLIQKLVEGVPVRGVLPGEPFQELFARKLRETQ